MLALIRSFFFSLLLLLPFFFFSFRVSEILSPSEAENPITSAAEEEFHFLWLPRFYSVCINVNRVDQCFPISNLSLDSKFERVPKSSEIRFIFFWHSFVTNYRTRLDFTNSRCESMESKCFSRSVASHFASWIFISDLNTRFVKRDAGPAYPSTKLIVSYLFHTQIRDRASNISSLCIYIYMYICRLHSRPLYIHTSHQPPI